MRLGARASRAAARRIKAWRVDHAALDGWLKGRRGSRGAGSAAGWSARPPRAAAQTVFRPPHPLLSRSILFARAGVCADPFGAISAPPPGSGPCFRRRRNSSHCGRCCCLSAPRTRPLYSGESQRATEASVGHHWHAPPETPDARQFPLGSHGWSAESGQHFLTALVLGLRRAWHKSSLTAIRSATRRLRRWHSAIWALVAATSAAGIERLRVLPSTD